MTKHDHLDATDQLSDVCDGLRECSEVDVLQCLLLQPAWMFMDLANVTIWPHAPRSLHGDPGCNGGSLVCVQGILQRFDAHVCLLQGSRQQSNPVRTKYSTSLNGWRISPGHMPCRGSVYSASSKGGLGSCHRQAASRGLVQKRLPRINGMLQC